MVTQTVISNAAMNRAGHSTRRSKKRVIDGCGVTLQGAGTAYLRRYLVFWFHDAYYMLMVIAFFTGFTCQRQQKGSGQSLMVADFILVDYAWPSSADGSKLVRVEIKLGRVKMPTSAMTTYCRKCNMPSTANSIPTMTMSLFLTMLTHTQSGPRSHFLPATYLRALPSPMQIGWCRPRSMVIMGKLCMAPMAYMIIAATNKFYSTNLSL